MFIPLKVEISQDWRALILVNFSCAKARCILKFGSPKKGTPAQYAGVP